MADLSANFQFYLDHQKELVKKYDAFSVAWLRLRFQ